MYGAIHGDYGVYEGENNIQDFNEWGIVYTLTNDTNTTKGYPGYVGKTEVVDFEFNHRATLDVYGVNWGEPEINRTESWGVAHNWEIINFTYNSSSLPNVVNLDTL